LLSQESGLAVPDGESADRDAECDEDGVGMENSAQSLVDLVEQENNEAEAVGEDVSSSDSEKEDNDEEGPESREKFSQAGHEAPARQAEKRMGGGMEDRRGEDIEGMTPDTFWFKTDEDEGTVPSHAGKKYLDEANPKVAAKKSVFCDVLVNALWNLVTLFMSDTALRLLSSLLYSHYSWDRTRHSWRVTTIHGGHWQTNASSFLGLFVVSEYLAMPCFVIV
jgi:hypothetical protein